MSAYQIEDAEEGGFYISKVGVANGLWPIVFACTSIDEALVYIHSQMAAPGEIGGGAKIKYR